MLFAVHVTHACNTAQVIFQCAAEHALQLERVENGMCHTKHLISTNSVYKRWIYVFSYCLHHDCKLSKAVFSCLPAAFLTFSFVWYLSSSSGLFQARNSSGAQVMDCLICIFFLVSFQIICKLPASRSLNKIRKKRHSFSSSLTRTF